MNEGRSSQPTAIQLVNWHYVFKAKNCYRYCSLGEKVYFQNSASIRGYFAGDGGISLPEVLQIVAKKNGISLFKL